MARSRDRKRRNTQEDSATAEPRQRRRFRRGPILLMALLLLGATAYFLPAIIAVTPLKQTAIDWALAKFKGRVTIQSASLGWFSPVELKGFSATDSRGETLLSAESITTDKSLLTLLSGNDYGRIVLTRPLANLRLRTDGSNFEDAIEDLLPNTASDDAGVPLEIHFASAAASVSVEDSARLWNLSQVTATVTLFQGEAPLSAHLSGSLTATDVSPGQFQAGMRVAPGNEELTFSSGTIELKGNNLPIDVASPLISRFVEPAVFSGVLHGEMAVDWSEWGSRFAIRAAPATVQPFRCALPRRLGRDQIQLASLKIKGDLSVSPQQLDAREFQCVTDAGQFRADGQLPWNEIQMLTHSGQIPEADFNADGQFDLARIAAMLPETLALHNDVAIESGQINVTASSRREANDRRLKLNATTAGLTAIRGGQRIQWQKPVRLATTIRQSGDATIIESLDCETNFLRINGSATTEQGEFVATGDLGAALAEARNFFDWGKWQIAGQFDGQFAWQFDGDGQTPLTDRPIRLGGQFQIKNPSINLPGQTSWQQPQIDVLVQASGQRSAGQGEPHHIRIDRGNLQLSSGRESLVAELAEPVFNPLMNTRWKMNTRVTGGVGNWLAQLKTFIPVPANASGQMDASALLEFTPEQVTVHQCSYDLKNLHFDGYGLKVSEPKLFGQGRLIYHLSNGAVEASDFTLASSTVSARGQQIRFDPVPGQTALQGTLAFRADINRLLACLDQPRAAEAIQWFGKSEGTLQFQTDQQSIGGKLSTSVTDLIAARPVRQSSGSGVQNIANSANWERLLDEKLVQLESTMRMDRSLNRIDIDEMKLDASAAQVRARGSLADISNALIADLQGSWKPNWARLKPLIDNFLGQSLLLNGVDGDSFIVQGPLLPTGNMPSPAGQPSTDPWVDPRLRAATMINWQGGQLLGMPIGPSRLKLDLSESWLSCSSGAIPLSGGSVHLSPRINLRGDQPLLEMPRGKVIDRVQLTPALCGSWLKYVAPVLSEITSAEGQFSARIGKFQVPLGNVNSAEVAGALDLHGGHVGPGPLGRQLVTLIGQVKALANGSLLNLGAAPPQTQSTWITLPEQNVPFEFKQGRVYHNGLSLVVDGVTVKTRGSVGLDQSIHLTAEVPILDKWVGPHPWLQGLKGKSLNIPVGGTMSQPRIDTSRLQQLAQQLAGQAATGAVQDQLNGLFEKGSDKLENELLKGLDKLLGPKKQ